MTTPYKDLDLPVEGEADWDTLLNTALAVLADHAYYVMKTADEAGPNTTTLQDDNHLLFSNLAAGTYLVEGFIFYSRTSGLSSLLKVGWTITDASATFQWYSGWPAGGNAADSSKTGTENGQTSGGAKSSMGLHGLLVLTTTGTLQMQWANSTGTDPITIYKGSCLRCTKVA
jgi:hypothetical protein